MRSRREALLLALLAIQFGAQPFLRRSCSASVPPVSMVLATDVTKCMLSFAALCFQGLRQSMAGWTLRNHYQYNSRRGFYRRTLGVSACIAELPRLAFGEGSGLNVARAF